MDEMQLRFDGHPVDVYMGKFAGAFDLAEADELVRYDQTVYLLVRARAIGAGFGETNGGDIKRTTTFQVQQYTNLGPEVGGRIFSAKDAQLSFSVDKSELMLDDEDDD